jgi:hypothetical protein
MNIAAKFTIPGLEENSKIILLGSQVRWGEMNH